MLVLGYDQLGAGLLVQIDNASSDKCEVGSSKFWQAERKRNTTLEPWLDRVAVGRNDIDRIGAGQLWTESRDHTRD